MEFTMQQRITIQGEIHYVENLVELMSPMHEKSIDFSKDSKVFCQS